MSRNALTFDYSFNISIILPTYEIIREYFKSKENSFQCVGTNQTLQAYLQVLKNVIVEVYAQAWRSE